MVPHVVSKSIFSVKSLHTKVTFIESLSVSPHVPQQDKSSGEFFLAGLTFKRFFTSVVPHMVIENITPVECLVAILALKLFIFQMCLYVSFKYFHFSKLFVA